MLEDPRQFQMTLEGTVTISSGKMLIIDPCYVKNVDFDWFERFMPDIWLSPDAREHHKLEMELLENCTHCFDKANEYLEAALAAAKQGKAWPKPPSQEQYDAFKEKKKRFDELDRSLKQLVKEWKYSPPHFLQGNGRVYFQTLVGDGLYPVTRSSNEYVIGLNNWGEKPGVLGLVAVDAITIMITDAKDITIDDSNSTFKPYKEAKQYGVHCKLDVPKGTYKCKYTKGNKTVKIALHE